MPRLGHEYCVYTLLEDMQATSPHSFSKLQPLAQHLPTKAELLPQKLGIKSIQSPVLKTFAPLGGPQQGMATACDSLGFLLTFSTSQ